MPSVLFSMLADNLSNVSKLATDQAEKFRYTNKIDRDVVNDLAVAETAIRESLEFLVDTRRKAEANLGHKTELGEELKDLADKIAGAATVGRNLKLHARTISEVLELVDIAVFKEVWGELPEDRRAALSEVIK